MSNDSVKTVTPITAWESGRRRGNCVCADSPMQAKIEWLASGLTDAATHGYDDVLTPEGNCMTVARAQQELSACNSDRNDWCNDNCMAVIHLADSLDDFGYCPVEPINSLGSYRSSLDTHYGIPMPAPGENRIRLERERYINDAARAQMDAQDDLYFKELQRTEQDSVQFDRDEVIAARWSDLIRLLGECDQTIENPEVNAWVNSRIKSKDDELRGLCSCVYSLLKRLGREPELGNDSTKGKGMSGGEMALATLSGKFKVKAPPAMTPEEANFLAALEAATDRDEREVILWEMRDAAEDAAG